MKPKPKPDPIRAAVELDVDRIELIPGHLTHPARLYQSQPWTGAPVTVFPTARNWRAVAKVALRVHRSRSGRALADALETHAHRLHAMHVPLNQARREMRAYHSLLLEFLDALAEEAASA